MVERRGKEVHQEVETKDGVRKRRRMQWGEAWETIEGIIDRGEQPQTG